LPVCRVKEREEIKSKYLQATPAIRPVCFPVQY
jgi:hypothetical protein